MQEEIANTLSNNGVNSSDINIFIKDRRSKEKEPFVKLFQKQSEIINNCQPATSKLFLYFLQSTQYGNYVEADIKLISGIINLSERTVKRALKELIEKNVIVTYKDTNDKRRNCYYINPFAVWKGNPSDRQKSIKALNPDQLLLF
jgi:Fic family protein